MCISGEKNGVKFRVQTDGPLTMQTIKIIEKLVLVAYTKGIKSKSIKHGNGKN